MTVTYSSLADFAAHQGIDVTAAGSNNTKGSWTQIVASTAITTTSLIIQALRCTSIRNFLFDVGTGAGGAEAILLPNMMIMSGNDAGAVGSFQVRLHIDIPSSTRFAVRTQSSTAGATLSFNAMLINGACDDALTFSSINVYGADTTITRGVAIDPGSTISTKGAYFQLTSSAAAALKMLQLTVGLNLNSLPSFVGWWIDLATGAGGSETVVIPDWCTQCSDLGDQIVPNTIMLPIEIAASTRIALRSAAWTTDAADRLFHALIHAYQSTTPGASSGGAPLVGAGGLAA